VQGLQKSFDDLQVLRGVDLDVEPGSILALLGSNGAGKTTLVRILSTLLKADAGAATSTASTSRPRPPRCASRSASPGSSPPSTRSSPDGRTSCSSPSCGTCDEPETVADDLLERFSLTEAADRKVSTYSGGMRRRLDIAMSLIGDPPVIFLDEPTTGLDPEVRLEVWRTIEQLAAHGTTVLLTTQHLDEAEQLADRIAILHEGGSSRTAPSPSSNSS
jgi:ABC-2 type transport system ATP-binding protein